MWKTIGFFRTQNFVSSFCRRQCSQDASKQKVLRIAVLGTPNAGKSTLINQIVGFRVSAVSHIRHTTRTQTNGIINIGETQLIFCDTPGIVSVGEGRRLRLDRAHMRVPRRIADSVDLLAVVNDVLCKKTRSYIDQNLLEVLHKNSNVPAVLILNKIDLLQHKESLIPIASMLLRNRKKDIWGYESHGGSDKFDKCFMISAHTGDGVSDLVDYFLSQAQPSKWEYLDNVFSDASVEFQIAEVFRESLLTLFPHEIPWQVKQDTVIFYGDEDNVRIHQKLMWPRKSQSRYVTSLQEQLLTACQDALEKIFQCHVHLTVEIADKKGLTSDDLKLY